ncbi:MAG: hypothetical protein GY742_02565, partial [Hyphomicrobiales bacterium]|nr:hypothetical protein [Hyphomicrobiales bacterium]
MKLRQRWATAVMAAVVVVLGLAVGIAAAANVPLPGPAHSGSRPNTTTTSVGATPQIAIVHQGAALHHGATRDVAITSASGVIDGSYGLSVSFVAPRGVPGVRTPDGIADQATDAASLAARADVEGGAQIWRVGTTGRSNA